MTDILAGWGYVVNSFFKFSCRDKRYALLFRKNSCVDNYFYG